MSPHSQQTASLKLWQKSKNPSRHENIDMDKSIPLISFYAAFFSFNLWFYFLSFLENSRNFNLLPYCSYYQIEKFSFFSIRTRIFLA